MIAKGLLNKAIKKAPHPKGRSARGTTQIKDPKGSTHSSNELLRLHLA